MGSSKGQSLLCIVRARTGMKKTYSIKAKRGKFIADKAIELLLFICFDCSKRIQDCLNEGLFLYYLSARRKKCYAFLSKSIRYLYAVIQSNPECLSYCFVLYEILRKNCREDVCVQATQASKCFFALRIGSGLSCSLSNPYLSIYCSIIWLKPSSCCSSS